MRDVSPLSKLGEECMPLGSTEIDKFLSLEDLDEDQRFGRRKVLDLKNAQVRYEHTYDFDGAYVVAISDWEDRSVTGLKIESPRSRTARKGGSSSMTGDDVKPF